jgi:hypothetical protein
MVAKVGRKSVEEAEDCSYVWLRQINRLFLCSLLAYSTYRCADGTISELSHRLPMGRHGCLLWSDG